MRPKRSLLTLCSLHNKLRAKKIEKTYRKNGISLAKTDLRAIALEMPHPGEEGFG